MTALVLRICAQPITDTPTPSCSVFDASSHGSATGTIAAWCWVDGAYVSFTGAVATSGYVFSGSVGGPSDVVCDFDLTLDSGDSVSLHGNPLGGISITWGALTSATLARINAIGDWTIPYFLGSLDYAISTADSVDLSFFNLAIHVNLDADVSLSPPPGATLPGDLLMHRVGHWVAHAGDIHRAWHPDMAISDTFTYDSDPGIKEERLAMEPHMERLSIVYAKPSPTDTSVYDTHRKISHDWGATWGVESTDLDPLLPGIKHAYEIVNYRTHERCLLYQDASDTDPDTSLPTGRGKIQCKVFDQLGAVVGIFPADGLGIGNTLADDTSFSTYYEPEPTSYLACTFASYGERKVYRSYDDGRTWGEWTDAPTDGGVEAGSADELIMFQPPTRF